MMAGFSNPIGSVQGTLAQSLLVRNFSDFVQPANLDLGPDYCGDQPHLGVFFQSFSGHFRVQFNYFTDEGALGLLFGQQTLHIRQGKTFQQSLPQLGPFVRTSLSPDVPNSLRQCDMTLWQQKAPFNTEDTDFPPLIEQAGIAVAAGGNRTEDANATHVGEALMWVQTDAATWQVNLRMVNYLNAFNELCVINQVMAASMPVKVFLPGRMARMVFTNTSGAGATCRMGLVARPTQPAA